ncbi:MAG: arginine repressor [Oscillospiraceae bacterium]|nr:arginine repressor [Oscillospiraceae bacterium]
MKSKRQQEILNIIALREVETQEQLLECLRERGITTTQATVSRDIKQLHLVKELTAGGIYKYAVSQRKTAMDFAGRLRTIFREGVTSFDVAQNIVVLKTMPGLANAAGAAMDGMDIPDLVGSLAGDDTAILIMRTNEAATEFCEEIREMLA